jgi:hypothetical protein
MAITVTLDESEVKLVLGILNHVSNAHAYSNATWNRNPTPNDDKLTGIIERLYKSIAEPCS